jgi:diacylglycerol kinase family enzyme
MHIAPTASLDDGLLDVVVITAPDRRRRWQLVRSLPRLYDGSHVELDEVLVMRGAEVTISADRPVTSYGDGERHTDLPLTATVRPGALQVLS